MVTTPLRISLVGLGVAGRLHRSILGRMGARLTVVDPQQERAGEAPSWPSVDAMPTAAVAGTDVWSVCCPTADHLGVLRRILARQPSARVVLEKPACASAEVDDFRQLLASHPTARVVVIDQYAHARALDALGTTLAAHEPGRPVPQRVRVAFTKDRAADIAAGRFVDRDYGVLGYEWLHMLAVLRRVLPAPANTAYLTGDVGESLLRASYHPEFHTTALEERTVLASGTTLEMYSSILEPYVSDAPAPRDTSRWLPPGAARADRGRYVCMQAGETHARVDLDPVIAPGGWSLPRNTHRLTVRRSGELVEDRLITDSPLETAIRRGIDTLTGEAPVGAPDPGPLLRISRLADRLRGPADANGPAPTAASAGGDPLEAGHPAPASPRAHRPHRVGPGHPHLSPAPSTP
ncbi:Gfo/Idh/MocA family oxidoreductase [Streptomyces sp. 4503]|uniref:Gfo/Idh/MocA family oxidoreductase n=1 Tax=Streptomyces niphimycinicus TaxID=2842201 RepID=A0ABS6C715_9ACTN|nr:Gfo/Idh/MocA family oxidoreductase [Streptomyces niphimycinicus]MBU3862649.1 Gfo/Idh/MocA family oxidoreductase [Streptomyces niphimycinicus]